MKLRDLVVRSLLAMSLFALPASCAATTNKNMSTERHMALVKGLDRVTYEGYKPDLVKKVQTALKSDGLYQGDTNGKLDKATMKAIGEFQQKHHLERSGIPTPRTRKELLKG